MGNSLFVTKEQLYGRNLMKTWPAKWRTVVQTRIFAKHFVDCSMYIHGSLKKKKANTRIFPKGTD